MLLQRVIGGPIFNGEVPAPRLVCADKRPARGCGADGAPVSVPVGPLRLRGEALRDPTNQIEEPPWDSRDRAQNEKRRDDRGWHDQPRVLVETREDSPRD